MSSKLITRTILGTAVVGATLFLAACQEESTTTERQESQRDRVAEAADRSVPAYQASNFVVRNTVNEYMRRMDDPNKIFYLYVMSDMGTPIGYYVARTPAVNICTFLTPPERVERQRHALLPPARDLRRLAVGRQAPALDGVFYGSGACNTEYFFDAETDAMIQIQGLNLFISDQPIQNIDAPRFQMQTQEEN